MIFAKGRENLSPRFILRALGNQIHQAPRPVHAKQARCRSFQDINLLKAIGFLAGGCEVIGPRRQSIAIGRKRRIKSPDTDIVIPHIRSVFARLHACTIGHRLLHILHIARFQFLLRHDRNGGGIIQNRRIGFRCGARPAGNNAVACRTHRAIGPLCIALNPDRIKNFAFGGGTGYDLFDHHRAVIGNIVTQATSGKQPVQRLLRCHAAADRRRINPAHKRPIHRNLKPRLLPEQGQRTGHRLRRDIKRM